MKPGSNTIVSPKRLIAAAILITLAPLAASAQNLITDGSFESIPPVYQYMYTVTHGGLPTNGVPGWDFGVSSGASYDGDVDNRLLGPTGVIEDGSLCAFVQGTGSIWQNVSLTGGNNYVLSFFLMGRAPANGPDPTLVSLGGLLSVTDTPNNTANNLLSDWIQYSYNVTVPTTGTYTLAFAGTVPFGTQDLSTYVDNVSLVATPEPSSIALIGLGAAALLFVRRYSPARN